MKALAAWCCLVQITFAVNSREMTHKARPAVDHSSSLLMAPPIQRSEIAFQHAGKGQSILKKLQAATSFKSLRVKAESLCPRSRNSTQVCSGESICFRIYAIKERS